MVMVMVMVVIVIVIIIEASVLHKHLAVVQVLAVLSIVSIGRKAGRGQRRRILDRFGGFLGQSRFE